MTFRCRAVACTLLPGLLGLVAVPPCRAQSPQAPGGLKQLRAPLDGTPYTHRTDAFRRLLFEFRFQPLHNFAQLLANPSESLFIMLGNPSCLREGNFPEGLRSFVEEGGAVLIATDKPTEGEAGDNLRDLAGVRVTEETLVIRHPSTPGGSLHRYDNSEYCPFVEPLENSLFASRSTGVLGTLAALLGTGGRPDLFRRGPQPDSSRLEVATNAPSRLQQMGWWLPSGIHRLARLPAACEGEKLMLLLNPNGIEQRRFVDEKGPLFAVGGTRGEGRVLVLADHSIFINRMILASDNGNLEFAANCLHWLRGGVSTPTEALRAANSTDAVQKLAGQRKRVLFWDDGSFRTDFEVPLKKVSLPPVLPSEPAIVAAIDKTITKLEDEDFFNNKLLESMDDLPGGRPRVIRNVVYLLTLASLLLLAYLFVWRTRHRPESTVPLLEDAIRKHEPKGSLLDQRRRALLRLGNLWEMGHRLARECFESAGIAVTGTSPPLVVLAQGNWRQRWLVHRRVERLWRLARSNAPVPLSPAALHQRLRELEELKTALADGRIRLT